MAEVGSVHHFSCVHTVSDSQSHRYSWDPAAQADHTDRSGGPEATVRVCVHPHLRGTMPVGGGGDAWVPCACMCEVCAVHACAFVSACTLIPGLFRLSHGA